MILIDYRDRRPIYEQIVERFQMLILKGILEPDTQMPSVRKLATDLAINPNTIQKAYAMLEQDGFIYPVKGRGNFVAGGEKLVRQKQAAFLEKFREQAGQAKELGIAKEALLAQIQDVYEGGAPTDAEVLPKASGIARPDRGAGILRTGHSTEILQTDRNAEVLQTDRNAEVSQTGHGVDTDPAAAESSGKLAEKSGKREGEHHD